MADMRQSDFEYRPVGVPQIAYQRSEVNAFYIVGITAYEVANGKKCGCVHLIAGADASGAGVAESVSDVESAQHMQQKVVVTHHLAEPVCGSIACLSVYHAANLHHFPSPCNTLCRVISPLLRKCLHFPVAFARIFIYLCILIATNDDRRRYYHST